MPRTKRPVNKKTTETDETLKKLDKLVANQKKNIENRVQIEIRNLELAFKLLLGEINDNELSKTLAQLRADDQCKRSSDGFTDISKRTPQSCSASQDDGYLTENSSRSSADKGKKSTRPMPSARKTGRRSRSADTSRKHCPPPSVKRAPTRRSRSVYQTPAYNKNAPQVYPTITPKVAPQTPITMLRQPRQGEMVVSMSGSPLMVPTCNTMQPEEQANCNIRLKDGTMLSLQPRQLRESQVYIPFTLMDSNMLEQLKTLKDNLGKMVQLGKKAIDN